MNFKKYYRQQLYLQPKEVHIYIGHEDQVVQKLSSKKVEDDDNCAIRKVIRFGSLLKFLPFFWDPVAGKIMAARSQERLLVNVNLTWIFAYVGIKLYFLVFRQLYNHACNKVSYSIFGSVSFIMFGLAFLLHLNNVLHLEDIVCTVNTYCHRIRGHLGKIWLAGNIFN